MHDGNLIEQYGSKSVVESSTTEFCWLFVLEMDETLQPSYTTVPQCPETRGFIVLTGNGNNHTMNCHGTSLSTMDEQPPCKHRLHLLTILSLALIFLAIMDRSWSRSYRGWRQDVLSRSYIHRRPCVSGLFVPIQELVYEKPLSCVNITGCFGMHRCLGRGFLTLWHQMMTTVYLLGRSSRLCPGLL